MRDAIDAQEWDRITSRPECPKGIDCEFDDFTYYEHPLIHYLITKGLLTHDGVGELWGDTFSSEDEEIAERLAGDRITGEDWLMIINHHPSPVLLRYLYDTGVIELHSELSARLLCGMSARMAEPHSRPVLELLVELGENMNLQAWHTHATPLYSCLSRLYVNNDGEIPNFDIHLEGIRWLLERGADPCLPVRDGRTPLSYAAELPEQHHRVLELLEQYM
jgi:hypothetical protein